MISAPDSQPFFVFQETGDARLRGVSWDGSISGLFTQSGPFGLSLQSPDGRYVVLNETLYDRHGHAIGAFPWPSKDMRVTWSPDGSVMCKVPDVGVVTGVALQLQIAIPGQVARSVAQGFGTFHDQSGFPVLACDPKNDLAIVAEFSQGFMPSQAWVIQISTGQVLRSIAGPAAPIAASPDGLMLASSPLGGSISQTTITDAKSGRILGKVNDFAAHGFSGDSSLLIGEGPNHSTVILDWRTGRRVWSSNAAPYFGYLAEPGGSHLVVGLISATGTIGAAYLIGANGSVLQLPTGIAAGLQP